jgi:hypothetical protein
MLYGYAMKEIERIVMALLLGTIQDGGGGEY